MAMTKSATGDTLNDGLTPAQISDQEQASFVRPTAEESETLLIQSAAMANLGYAVWDYIGEEFVTVSEEYAGIYGYTKEGFLATFTSLEQDLELLLPEDRERYRAYYEDDDPDNLTPDIEFRIVRRDGEIRHLHQRYKCAFNESGERTQSLISVLDITERKQAEKALEKSEALLTQSAEMANLGHAVWDYVDEKYITVSEGWARIFGYSKESFLETITNLGKDFELILPEDRDRYRTYYDNEDPDLKAPDIEYRVVRRSGEVRYIYERYRYVLDSSGERTQVLVTIQDITKRKQAEEALEKTDELLTPERRNGESGSRCVGLHRRKIHRCVRRMGKNFRVPHKRNTWRRSRIWKRTLRISIQRIASVTVSITKIRTQITWRRKSSTGSFDATAKSGISMSASSMCWTRLVSGRSCSFPFRTLPSATTRSRLCPFRRPTMP